MRYSEVENFFSTAEVFIPDNTLRIRHSNFIVLAVAFTITHAILLGHGGGRTDDFSPLLCFVCVNFFFF